MKRLNFIAGGVWHLPYHLRLFSVIKNFEKRVITSIPKKIYKSYGYNLIFIPKYSQIFEKILKIKIHKRLKLIDDLQFSYFASKFVKKGDINIGWQGFLYNSLLKNFGNLNILDRACPHILDQEKILKEQSELLDLKYDEKPEFILKRTNFEYENSDIIIVPSNFTKNSFIKYGFEEKKIIKMPLLRIQKNLVSVKKNVGEITYGFLGGDIRRKGIYYLLKAWKNANLKNNKLIIKSKTSDLTKSSVLKELIKDQKNIYYVDYFKDISDFYNQIDILVFPSSDDGFGMVVAESLYLNKFVIVSKNTGASEFIVDGENGYTYDYNNIDQLTNLLILTSKDKNEITNNGRSNLKKFLENEEINANNFVQKIQNYS